MISRVIARALVVVVSVLVVGWLGVMERDARLLSRGTQASASTTTSAGFARADADLRRARLLNPDTTPDLYLALLYNRRGQLSRSVSSVEGVLRSEPENLRAWSALLFVKLYVRGAKDAGAIRRAQAALRRLDPLDADELIRR